MALFLSVLLLTSCRGMGISSLDSDEKWTTMDAGDKADESWWDNFWGRKHVGHESEDWKDYYDMPNDHVERYEHCGYWGNWKNCRNMQAPSAAPNCDFYGNCGSTKSGLGW